MELIRTFPEWPRRDATGHKGTYGTVLGIGGSRGMAGAIALAGRAALLAGAGLARLAVPDPILETVAGFYPEATTIPCPADRKGRFSFDALQTLLREARSATAVFLGPGLGRSPGLDRLVFRLLQELERPLVVDADALNALSETGQIFDLFSDEQRAFVLTPHPGEFARLTGKPTPPESEPEYRQKAATEFARKHGVVLVLKGHATITTDGRRGTVNTTGNPGMATGGSGDVLTGVITALLAQGFDPFDAARLGVHLHGLAGDRAAARYGEESVLASSILEMIPEAVPVFRAEKKSRS